MKGLRAWGRWVLRSYLALFLGGSLGGTAWAAEAPILRTLQGGERERVARLIEEARKERKLVWASNIITTEAATALAKAFQERYALKDLEPEFAYRTTSITVRRTEEELRAGKLQLDVVVQGTVAWFHSLGRRGELVQYDSPEDKAYAPAGRAGMNAPGSWVADAQVNTIAWNPRLVPGASITSWRDLLDPRWKGKILVGDAGRTETYAFWYMGLRKVLPKSYFEQLRDTGTGLILRSDLQRQALIAGEFAVGTTITPRHAFIATRQGAPLEVAYPKEGVVGLPVASVILSKAPHPNAARLFIDFYRSVQGNHIVMEYDPLNFGRANLPPHPDPKVNALAMRLAPPVEKLNIIPMEWDKVTPDDVKKWQAEFTSIFGTGTR